MRSHQSRAMACRRHEVSKRYRLFWFPKSHLHLQSRQGYGSDCLDRWLSLKRDPKLRDDFLVQIHKSAHAEYRRVREDATRAEPWLRPWQQERLLALRLLLTTVQLSVCPNQFANSLFFERLNFE